MLTLLAALLGLTTSFAQADVKGVVTGSGKLPLQGVTIQEKNTGKATTTDQLGQFSIKASGKAVLVFSYVGYITREIAVNDRAVIDLELQPGSNAMNEVIVTALGLKKETRRLGYAIQEIKGSDLVKAREPNAINSLKGNIAGLVINISPEISRAPDVNLRGEGRPIFVVDGVPINSDTWNISPDDIESYTILKGPNAAALYGFAGREGAIIINTKKGSKDRRGFSIEFNSSTQFNKGFIALPKYQDEYGPGELGAYAFVDGKGGGINDNDYDVWGPKFMGQLIPQYDGKVVKNALGGDSILPTPWVARGKDNLKRFLQTGILSTNSIALSSTTDKSEIRFSVSNTYQKGIVPNTQLNTTFFNGSMAYNFSPRLRLTSNFNYSRQATPNIPDVNYGPNSIIYNIIVWGGADWDIRDMRNYWQPGKVGIQEKYAEYFRYNNPYFMSYEWLRGHTKNDVYGYMTLSYKLNDHIDFLLRPSVTGYDMLNTEKLPYSATVYGRPEHQGDYREDRRSLFESNIEAQAKYHRNNILGFLNIDGLIGGVVRSFKFNSDFTSTDYLNVPGIYSFANSKNPIVASSFNSEMKVLSAYYSVDLGYKSYIDANITGRLDKSSTLPLVNNVYFYPSFNLSTLVSEYVKLPKAISFLKVRASYAESKQGGTQGFFSPSFVGAAGSYGYNYPSSYGGPSYSFTPTYSLSRYYNNQAGASFTNQLINQDIKTQDRKAYEAGIDIRFLENRLGLDITRYRYVNGPLIYSKSISQATGYSSYLLNAGKYTNNGWEVTVNATPFKHPGGFSWNVAANWSTYLRKWVDYPNADKWQYNGSRVDLVYGNAFVRTPGGKLVHDASSGLLLRYSDLGVSAKKIYGHSDPDWTWGLVNTVGWKNLSLRFQFDGMVGGVMEDYVRKKTLQGGRHIETIQGAFGKARPDDATGNFSYIGDGVTLTGGRIQLDPVTGAIVNYRNLTEQPNTTKTSVQDYVSRMASIADLDIIKKTYVKLREVTISYSLNSLFGKKSFVKQATVSLVGRNLLYFFPSRYKDIDVDQYSQDSGADLQTPTIRSYGFNVNFIF
jgi:TonB-linked SusC/RagA family outer membrane protein